MVFCDPGLNKGAGIFPMFVLRTRATRGEKNTEESLDDSEARVKVFSMPLVGLEQVLLFL